MNRYEVRFTKHADADLDRLFDFLLEHDTATSERALETIRDALHFLTRFPFSCRKAGDGQHGPRLRELIIPFGSSGYVALFEIEDARTVTVLAVRHQREADYH